MLTRSSTIRDLARLLASWMVLILLVQATAAAVGTVQGPRHHHAAAKGTVPARPVAQHGAAALFLAHPVAHRHHDDMQRHVHPAFDVSDPAVPDDAQDAGATAAAALAALPAIASRAQGPGDATERRMHVLRAALPWNPTSAPQEPPERPPSA